MNFYVKNKMNRTGIAGIFAASLELTKEGVVKVSQDKMFDKLMIKKNTTVDNSFYIAPVFNELILNQQKPI